MQFLLIAVALIALNTYVFNSEDNHKIISIDDATLTGMVDHFRESKGRDPSAQEVEQLILSWSQNEIFYREALIQGLDKNDEAIRNRLIVRMHNQLRQQMLTEPASEQKLQAFLESRRDQYDTPERFDVEVVQFKPTDQYRTPKQLLSVLNEGSQSMTATAFQVMYYRQSPKKNLQLMFGEQAVEQLAAQELGQWMVFSISKGQYLARATERYPRVAVDVSEVRARLLRDWKKHRYDQQLVELSQALVNSYQVKMNFSPEAQQWLTGSDESEDQFARSKKAESQ